MLYALLHLFGYGLTMDDLKSFRQDGLLMPGHSAYGHRLNAKNAARHVVSRTFVWVATQLRERSERNKNPPAMRVEDKKLYKKHLSRLY